MRKAYFIRLVLAFVLILVSSHFVLVWMHFGIKYGALFGLESKVEELKVSGRGALLSIGLVCGLQLLIAYLLLPRRRRQENATDSLLFRNLPASQNMGIWKAYLACLGVSVLSTVVYVYLLLFLVKRSTPLVIDLQNCLIKGVDELIR
jgi:hypothetical protein